MSTTSKSLVFLGLTFAISWGAVGLGWALGAAADPARAIATMFAMMFGPSIAATICALAFEKGRRKAALGLRFKPNWWWLAAWAIALVIAFGASLISVAAGQAQFADIAANYIAQARIAMRENTAALDQAAQLPGLSWIILAQAAFLGGLINTVALTLTEELGWRGYLHHLWRGFGIVRYSIATGALWGLWHAPAILVFGLNYPDNRLLGAALFILYCILLSFPFTLVRDRGKSVIAASVLHGTLNAVGGVAMLGLSQAAFPWNGVVGIGGFIVLGLVAAASWAIGWRETLPARGAPVAEAAEHAQ